MEEPWEGAARKLARELAGAKDDRALARMEARADKLRIEARAARVALEQAAGRYQGRGERGGVHTFRGTYTKPDPEHPGKRRLWVLDNWYWRFTYRHKKHQSGLAPDGHQFPSRAAALQAGEARLAEIRAGHETDPEKVPWLQVEDAIRRRVAGTSATTRASAQAVLRRLAAFFGKDLVRDLDDTRLLQYKHAMIADGYQQSTIKLDLSYLRRGLTALFHKRLLRDLPDFPKLKRTRRQQTIQPFELDRLLAELPEEWRRFFLAADECGWRARSELKSRRWEDVDFTPGAGWLRLDAEHCKTGEARLFPMTEYLRTLLTEQRAYVASIEATTSQIVPWVFCRPDGRQIGDYREAWSAACVRAGFGKLVGRTGPWSSAKLPHDLRRGATNRWEGQIRDTVRAALSGHSRETFATYYATASSEDLQAAARQLDEARRSASANSKVTPFKRPAQREAEEA
jgi:hypothetical protein